MIDFFIERMAVLGRGLVFQPVLVTQTRTYNRTKEQNKNLNTIKK